MTEQTIAQEELRRIYRLEHEKGVVENIKAIVKTKLAIGTPIEPGPLTANLIKQERTPNWQKDALAAYIEKYGDDLAKVHKNAAAHNKTQIVGLKIKAAHNVEE